MKISAFNFLHLATALHTYRSSHTYPWHKPLRRDRSTRHSFPPMVPFDTIDTIGRIMKTTPSHGG